MMLSAAMGSRSAHILWALSVPGPCTPRYLLLGASPNCGTFAPPLISHRCDADGAFTHAESDATVLDRQVWPASAPRTNALLVFSSPHQRAPSKVIPNFDWAGRSASSRRFAGARADRDAHSRRGNRRALADLRRFDVEPLGQSVDRGLQLLRPSACRSGSQVSAGSESRPATDLVLIAVHESGKGSGRQSADSGPPIVRSPVVSTRSSTPSAALSASSRPSS